jgi:hypothetical protein
MRREITDPTTNEQGDDVHPSFGVVRLSRVSGGGKRLFDSSVPHSQWVTMEIARATRRRDLHHDWIYGSVHPLIEIEMSLTQWGALVSSFNEGSGTPVTLYRVGNEIMPESSHESRLAYTAREVKEQAVRSTDEVRAAVQAVTDAFESKAGRRDMLAAINTLQHTVDNLPANMKYAADRLTEHAEDVVSKAKADIDAARQFGGQPSIEAAPLGELEA